MVVGLGIDLIETQRIAALIARYPVRFERRVFTPAELRDCAGRSDRVQALAARFAAKEACMKALGTGWGEGVGFRQIELVRLSGGRPVLRLYGAAEARARALGVTRVLVSLTHQATAAAAVVVLEGAGERGPLVTPAE